MLGKTHMAAGVAVSLGVLMPDTPKEMLLCLTAAAVGGVISDIDVSTSDARRGFNRFLRAAGLAAAVSLIVECCFHLGIFRMIQRRGYAVSLLGLGCFVLICLFGKSKPHRTFMHSLLALALLTGAVYVMLPAAAVSFGLAMASHLVLDVFNKKRVKLLYPYHKGFAFYLCKADGTVNSILFYSACLADIFMIGFLIASYI